MSGLRTITGQIEALAGALLAGAETERCAVGYASRDPQSDSWVLVEAAPVDETAYASRDALSASLKPAVLVEIANKARALGLSPVFIHTHPHARGTPEFSGIDDAGEAEIKAYLDRRAPRSHPLAMVIGPDGLSARRLGEGAPVPVWEVGPSLRLLSGESENRIATRHDRQLRAFGAEGQRAIARLKLLVIGAGGTGSATVQQLAHLGARHLTIIDPDKVEETNLNRLIGATPGISASRRSRSPGGWSKPSIPRRTSRRSSGILSTRNMPGCLPDSTSSSCTDSHASRAVVGQAAYQYLVPAIDMGVSITVAEVAITHITGRVQMLAPSLPCLSCTGALDGEQIRRELLTPEQRAADPYLIGGHVPQPAVVSINATMASLAVTMFLGAVTSVPAQARFQRYDGLRGEVRRVAATARDDCIVCSASGALAKGAGWALPVRTSGGRHE